ncbi:hypothetical protein N9873_04285 [Akkermansiaceae bacterium]|nr:hypothetical protein [Akkermansiaceae bacterium]MDB4259562.1 hypothetical protein [Akkermansiaceae bacterium]MDB4273431.1 hypothetical protein [Akkermansiaceae bacterium]MDB4274723.1 hypothetical protein [Akkermansiaceae bacterium]MDB4283635.1 hypothetical protein [Akkermansiaceae bacterium]
MKAQLTALIAMVTLIITNVQADDLPEDVRHLVDVRETEIRKIDQAFVKALEKLKEQYIKKSDLETAVLIKQMIGNIKPSDPGKAALDEIVGRWLFETKGEDRYYTFFADGTMKGEVSSDGEVVIGTWRRDGKNIILTSKKFKGDWATIQMNALGGPRIKTKYGVVVSAQKKLE